MKKISTLAFATTLLSATSVFAANAPICAPAPTCPPPCPAPAPVCPPPCPPAPVCAKPAPCFKAFQGFFLGGNVGLGVGTGSQKLSVTETGGGRTVPLVTTSNRLGVRGFDGGLNVGYNHRICNWGLGLEFVANWTNSKGSRRHEDQLRAAATNTHSARLINSLQLRGNFSYVIANWVAPKLILGWDSAKWRQRTNLTGFGTLNPQGTAVVPFQAQRGKYLNAFLVGAGVDFIATNHVIIGMDATVSIYNKSSFARTHTNTAAGVAATNGINSVTQNGSFKPIYTKISLVMKFIY